MPPKKAPEPAPEPPQVEIPRGPPPLKTLNGIEVPGAAAIMWSKMKRRHAGPLDFAISASEDVYTRNADISKDPKMRELRKTMSSCKASLDLSGEDLIGRKTGQRDGVDATNKIANRIYREGMLARSTSHSALLGGGGGSSGSKCDLSTPPPLPQPAMQISPEMAALFEKRSLAAVAAENDARRPVQQKMMRTMEKLLQDMDFAQDDMLAEATAHLRCQHVDKMHSWADQQREKERQRMMMYATAPPFMTFSKDSPTMTGSTMPEAHERYYAPLPWGKPGQRPAWMDRGGPTGKARSTTSLFVNR
eukprot:TRINITY_DN9254_c0_g1_i1.p2 TRINITY_DN9254_c0_g1~~TRINITY_DN9254_c0_g1_i1.p2  ORF type:complete len:305 (+),score=93.25 TRINITY_DN9254_c0_g1_i1:77-991(+)